MSESFASKAFALDNGFCNTSNFAGKNSVNVLQNALGKCCHDVSPSKKPKPSELLKNHFIYIRLFKKHYENVSKNSVRDWWTHAIYVLSAFSCSYLIFWNKRPFPIVFAQWELYHQCGINRFSVFLHFVHNSCRRTKRIKNARSRWIFIQ